MVEKYLMLRTSKLFWYYSVYSQYSQYQYSQYRTKYCQYLAAPAVQIPQILGSAAVFHKQSIVQKY